MNLFNRFALACTVRLRCWRPLPRWVREGQLELERDYLQSLFRNHLSNSPACIVASLLLYSMAPVLPPGNAVTYWVIASVSLHVLRIVLSLAYVRRSAGSALAPHYWGCLSMLTQLIDGMLMLFLALAIYPQLDALSQSIVVMMSIIVVSATALSLGSHWLTIAVYAPPTYLGFAWSSWHQNHAFAKPVAILLVILLVVYLFQAYNHRRSIEQAMNLARRNGELARSHATLVEQLQVKNQELEEVAGARSRLLATVSHDLRQPSHAIGLLCERAMLDPSPAFVKEALSDLHELSQSLSASLTTLMDLTRLDAGLVKPKLSTISLSQALLRVEAEFAGSARNKGLEFSVALEDVWVRSDPVLLHGVLANLVSNAIKYTRVGRIDVEVTSQADKVNVFVRDTGHGIHPDKLELMFKEFVRLEGTESGAEGLGLGLSIVRRYAALLGHPLGVKSQLQQGTSFSLELPLVAVAASQTRHAPRSVAIKDERLTGLRVLVVDNVELVLTSMVRTLSAWGCQVHSARSLQEAQTVSRVQTLDVLISDFHLGDEEPDGLQLVHALRLQRDAALAPLPAMLMTGDVSSHLEAGAAAAGVGILHKPVRPTVLQDHLLDLLASLSPEGTAGQSGSGADAGVYRLQGGAQ